MEENSYFGNIKHTEPRNLNTENLEVIYARQMPIPEEVIIGDSQIVENWWSPPCHLHSNYYSSSSSTFPIYKEVW
jgi:hypothetical protein